MMLWFFLDEADAWAPFLVSVEQEADYNTSLSMFLQG